jgi:LPS-assembly protein
VRRLIYLLVSCIVFGEITCGRAAEISQEANPTDKDTPVLLKADQLRHERNLGIVVGRGNVEIAQGNRILRADTISYNQKTDILTATGNVVLMEPSGDITFADFVELSGDFKDGIVENIRILMSDDARLAAVGGRRIAGEVIEMNKVVYSPCRTCLGPGGPPLWQLKAVKVVHNKTEKTIEYYDAFMEFAGIPVLYSPYLSHPDPTVKRKTGFLTPRYGSDTELGAIVEIPYYFNIAPDKDATIQPIFTGNEGLVLTGEYRQRFTDGELKFEGSATRGSGSNESDENRGHFFGDVQFDLTDTWRTKLISELASDDTYLRRYRFRSPDPLTNHLIFEGFRSQNYASAEGYHWRGQSVSDEAGKTPIVAPLLNFNAVGSSGPFGGRWKIDANAMVLTRTNGTDSRRLSLLSGWELPHISSTGEIYRLYATLQTDGYLVDEVQEEGKVAGDLSSGFAGRVFPRIGLDWRLPFARPTGETTLVVEPMAGFMLSPNGGNPDKIPNEDSVDVEFDDTNLMSPSRFTGLDRVEGGQRVYYGLQLGAFGKSGHASGFLGQSYRIRRDNSFAVNSGLEENFSDIVGRVVIDPGYTIDAQYRFRLDKQTFEPLRNELQAKMGPEIFNVKVDYSFFGAGTGSGEFGDREEITTGFSSRIAKEWLLRGSTRRDLQSKDTLNFGLGIEYQCDCLNVALDFTRTFTSDRDLKPTDTIFVRFTFKNLGEFGSSVGP